jgi:hypothetical protein
MIPDCENYQQEKQWTGKRELTKKKQQKTVLDTVNLRYNKCFTSDLDAVNFPVTIANCVSHFESQLNSIGVT